LKDTNNDILTNSREEWVNIMKENNLIKNLDDHSWSYQLKLKIGRFLFEQILIKSCMIEGSLAKPSLRQEKLKSQKSNETKEFAFSLIYRQVGIYKDPQIKVHPLLHKLFASELIFESNKLPMQIPPIPWYAPTQGGYILAKSDLLRLRTDHPKQRELIEQSHPSNMYTIFDSLNTLSNCPWKINTRVLDIIIELFVKGGNKDLDLPEYHESNFPKYPERTEEMLTDKLAFKEFIQKKERAQKLCSEQHSLWCTELYRLSIANMYRDKTFWFPHSLDFRGRVYPIPPHFNHLGSDISRSIILLAEGKKLGDNGLDMLKIHLINLTGTMKKSSIDSRLAYANSIMSDIIDSAENPFSGKRWWQKSEEKWQTLACCFEIASALSTNEPSEFISHFPIHQDGSCNGLQHYAALGRDLDGAKSVNLIPDKLPQDVYSTVMDLVDLERIKDASSIEIAKQLEGFITRKVIKQTVMTTVYNVTFYGARLQIQKQLHDIKDFPSDQIRKASTYIAERTFMSITKLFSAAKEIQDWLCETAYLISRVRNETVKWETPLGLPISQPYYRKIIDKSSRVAKLGRPDSNKQRNAFPPNYIHSLDSCHMMLTSLYCEKAGITFVSVHDCFWTHASNVDVMNRICREQFVALHEKPLLENLAKSFLDKYMFTAEEINSQESEKLRILMLDFNKKLSNVPVKGQFDISQVLDSRYFFS
jgi:DNA-directed RNA polymerase